MGLDEDEVEVGEMVLLPERNDLDVCCQSLFVTCYILSTKGGPTLSVSQSFLRTETSSLVTEARSAGFAKSVGQGIPTSNFVVCREHGE